MGFKFAGSYVPFLDFSSKLMETNSVSLRQDDKILEFP